MSNSPPSRYVKFVSGNVDTNGIVGNSALLPHSILTRI